jgi:hypothetical protein
MSITVRFEGEGVPEVLRAAKREVKQRLKEGMLTAANDHVLPEVRRAAPRIVEGALTIKGAVKGPKVTSQGPRKYDNIAGYLNFGGYIKTPLAPKNPEGHQALAIGNGVIRARVTKPRHYVGSRFIERGIDAGFANFSEAVLEDVMQSFNGIPHEP